MADPLSGLLPTAPSTFSSSSSSFSSSSSSSSSLNTTFIYHTYEPDTSLTYSDTSLQRPSSLDSEPSLSTTLTSTSATPTPAGTPGPAISAPASTLPSRPADPNHEVGIAVGVALGGFCLVILGCLAWYYRRKKRAQMRLEDSSILGSLPGAPGAVDPYTKIELPHSGAITAALSPAPRVVGGDGKGDDTGVEGVAPTHDSENRGTDQRRTARDIYTTHPQLTTVISLFETIATTSNTHNAGLATSSLTDVASLSPPDTRSSISPPPSFRTQPSSVTLQTSYNHHVDSGIRFYPGEPQPRRVVDVPPEYSVD